MALPEVSADELLWNVITFSPAWVFVVGPFDEERKLVVPCRDAVFEYFLNSIFWTVGHFVQFSSFWDERGSVMWARGLRDSVRVYAHLWSMVKVRSLLCCTRYGPSAGDCSLPFFSLPSVGPKKT